MKNTKSYFQAAAVAVAPIFIFLLYFFRFWDIDLRVPFGYDGDALLHAALIKTMIESGWVYYNAQLGAPFGMDFFDFPGADGVLNIVLYIQTIFTSDHFLILNQFYIFGFIASYFSAYWSIRQFGISRTLSSAVALSFAVLPFHFLRGVKHLYLASYFVVPLLVVLAIDIFPGCKPKSTYRDHLDVWKKLFILFLAGMSGVYYAFFGAFIVFCAGVVGSIRENNREYLKKSIYCCLFISVGVIVNLAPSIAYRHQHGANAEVGVRQAIESEIYGLRITQLILPAWGHKSEALASLGKQYHEQLLVTEASSSALGILASIGFTTLMVIALFGATLGIDRRIEVLARINLASVILATVGGAGVLFALFVTPQFRGLNRISIFIGFISLVSLALIIQSIARRQLVSPLWSKWHLDKLLAMLIMLVAVYDQIPAGARGRNVGLEQNFYAEHEFFSSIESTLAPKCSIYQMPYMKFPEVAPAHNEGYQSMLKPYLHTQSVRWSYGSIKGRIGDAWNQELNRLSTGEMLYALKQSGFCGVHVHRQAYKDHAAALEIELRNEMRIIPIVSEDENYAFYKMNADVPVSIQPVVALVLGAGFYGWDADGGSLRWAWGNKRSEIQIFNLYQREMLVMLEAGLYSPNSKSVNIFKNNILIEDLRLVEGANIHFEKKIVLKPGLNIIRFETNLGAVKVGQDPRALALRVTEPKVILVNN